MRRLFQLALAATTLLLAGPAAAQAEKAQATAASQAAPATSGSSGAAAAPTAPRIRASHRVDVIAPGEKVETVIDRLRASRAASEARGAVGRSGERSGAVGAEGRHDAGDRGGAGEGDRPGGGEGERPGGDGMRGATSPMPGSNMPTQGERPHR